MSRSSSLVFQTALQATKSIRSRIPSLVLSLSRTLSSSSRSSSSADALVASTRRWMDRVVIGEKLCPFAPPLLADNTLRIVASSAANEQDAVAHIRLEAAELVGHSKEHARAETNGSAATLQRHETTLVVFDAPFVQEFRDFVRLSWILQDEAIVDGGYQKDLQLVLFHPKATHQTYSDACESGDGNDDGDENFAAGDYTIRSPYPTVHLLREVDVMRAVTGNYPNLPELPTRNKLKLMDQGYVHCKARLEECYIQGIGNEAETSTR